MSLEFLKENIDKDEYDLEEIITDEGYNIVKYGTDILGR